MTAVTTSQPSGSTKTVPDFFSPKGVAEHLGVNPSLIYAEIRSGRLRAVKIGTKVLRVPREALEEYVRAQSEGGK